MKVVIAPDSYKECLKSEEVAEAMAAGVRRADPQAEVVVVPMADGGQGTVDALVRATEGTKIQATVANALGEPITAFFGLLGRQGPPSTAVIEMAAASGIEQIPPERRDVMASSTFGTGQLVRMALDQGVKTIIIGVGGSATNDGGAGLAEALGFRLHDQQGQPIGPGGGELAKIASIDSASIDARLKNVQIFVACDVTNPFVGPEGASAVYGPQKGASPEQVQVLDKNLTHFASVIKSDLEIDIAQMPGAGAAGGLAGGLHAFCNAQLKRGIELVIDAVNLREHLKGADLCLTGEGALDRSSAFGKTAVGVAQVSHELGVPAIALSGAVIGEPHAVLDKGMTAFFDVTPRPCTRDEALAEAPANLTRMAEQVIRVFRAGLH